MSTTTLKRINVLAALCIGFGSLVSAQNVNSPYSRYGIGDLLPTQNILNRGMGGIGTAYYDVQAVNFLNPASYARFQNRRPVFDFGVEVDNLTIRSVADAKKYSNASPVISYLSIGIPLVIKKKPIWGIAFGLKPMSRVNYKIGRIEKLTGGTLNDSVTTIFEGNGGTQQAYFGTGFRLGEFSFGVNAGYLFGSKDYSTRRIFLNDTVSYYKSNHETKSNFNGFLFNAGAQYTVKFNTKTWMRLGVQGNWQQTIKGKRDLIRETFNYDASDGTFRIDSVFEQKDTKGNVVMPASYSAGVIFDRLGKWMIGMDYTTSQWSNYRFFGEKDAVQNSWQLSIGGQVFPTPGKNYWSNVAYRGGFSFGNDYINVGQELKKWTVGFGAALPIGGGSRYATQATIINTAIEVGRRGNDDNSVKESFFRIAVGISMSDFWFFKRKYE